MATYWEGSKKISKAQYDKTRAKHAAWTGPKVVDTPTSTRQPSGKQPVPAAPTSPLGIIDVRKNLEEYLKSPEGIAAGEKAKRLFLQEKADRKLVLPDIYDPQGIGEQPAAAATHGKEIVFEFSKPISSKANTYVSKLVKLLGGKRSYIENQTKLVVVM